MALIKCPKCGKEISDKALYCPHCFIEIKKKNNNIKEKKHIISWIISILSLIIGIMTLPSGWLILIASLIINPKFNKYLLIKYNIHISKFVIVLVYIFLLTLYLAAITGTETPDATSPHNITHTAKIKYTDIKKFDYEINGNSLKLQRYNGSDKTVKIADSYTIDNNVYTVTELENYIFNSSGVNRIYFPKTIISITDNLLAYLNDDHIDIFYEGSQDEWNNIFKIYQVNSVSDAYNSGDAQAFGVSLADKLNAKLGHTYDENKFTYHYNASIEDVTN